MWLHGNVLVGHAHVKSKTAAMKEMRILAKENYGYKRLPTGSCVCEIIDNYYKELNRMSAKIPFGAD